jgi:tetratricopeptide (TPR) repeat protein
MAFYELEQIQSSATAFEHALAQDPEDREAMQMEGVALFRMGKPAGAIPLLDQAHLSIPRTNIDSNYVLGLCYLDTRRYDAARNEMCSTMHKRSAKKHRWKAGLHWHRPCERVIVPLDKRGNP